MEPEICSLGMNNREYTKWSIDILEPFLIIIVKIIIVKIIKTENERGLWLDKHVQRVSEKNEMAFQEKLYYTTRNTGQQWG